MTVTIVKMVGESRQEELTRISLATMKQDDICISLGKGTNETEWFNKKDMQFKSKILHALAERRTMAGITLYEENNGKVKMLNGKTYHFFVVTYADDTKNTYDEFAVAQGIIVRGSVYFFRRAANRDALFKYIMGGKK